MCCSFADRIRRAALGTAIAAALLAGSGDGARAQAPAAVSVVETEPTDSTLAVTVSATGTPRVVTDGREVLIRFAGPIQAGAVEAFAARRADWLETVEYGYDSLVVRFLPDLTVSAEERDGAVTIRATRPTAADRPGSVDPQVVRLDYYRALTLIETGAVRQGRAILVAQHRLDPRNVEVILLLAQAEERLGRPERAVALLDAALELDPDLRQAALDKSRLHRETADTARLSIRGQSVKDADDQRIATLDGTFGLLTGTSLEYRLENRHLSVDEARRVDGRLAAFDGSRQFATIRLARRADDRPGLGASVFASGDTIGAGVDLTIAAGPTAWRLAAAIDEPEKAYIEGLIDGADRDRIAAGVQYQPDDRTQWSAGIALNRYAIDHENAGTGLELTGEVREVIYAPWPFLTVGYRLDAEYFDDVKTATAPDGTAFELLPLSSREAHTLDAGVEGQLTDYLRARAVGGFTVDRLNGHGPAAELELIYEPLPDLAIAAGMGTSLAVSRGTQSQLIFGGLNVRTRF